jgi:hypothetical protein
MSRTVCWLGGIPGRGAGRIRQNAGLVDDRRLAALITFCLRLKLLYKGAER